MNSRRRSALVLLAALVASTLFGCAKYQQTQANDKAKFRVKGILEGVQKGGAGTSADVQQSICLWYNGKILINDVDTLARAWEKYTAWQIEGGIARKISGFTVLSAEPMGSGVIHVSGTIEGSPFTMKVPEGRPISWVKSPRS